MLKKLTIGTRRLIILGLILMAMTGCLMKDLEPLKLVIVGLLALIKSDEEGGSK